MTGTRKNRVGLWSQSAAHVPVGDDPGSVRDIDVAAAFLSRPGAFNGPPSGDAGVRLTRGAGFCQVDRHALDQGAEPVNLVAQLFDFSLVAGPLARQGEGRARLGEVVVVETVGVSAGFQLGFFVLDEQAHDVGLGGGVALGQAQTASGGHPRLAVPVGVAHPVQLVHRPAGLPWSRLGSRPRSHPRSGLAVDVQASRRSCA